MKLPANKAVRDAYDYAVWLRGQKHLDKRDRMLCDLGIEIQALRNWIREEGARTNTCTANVLREEICEGCKCGKTKGTP